MYAIRSYYEIGSRVASGQARDYQIKRANYVIDRYLLPHLGNEPHDRAAKANFLGRMAESVITSYSIHYTKLYDPIHFRPS